jgi:hypothetical protein
MLTDDLGTLNNSATNSTHAWLALPSTGGAVNESLSASPSSPATALRFARGWTFTANVAPEASARMGITFEFEHGKWQMAKKNPTQRTRRTQREFKTHPRIYADCGWPRIFGMNVDIRDHRRSWDDLEKFVFKNSSCSEGSRATNPMAQFPLRPPRPLRQVFAFLDPKIAVPTRTQVDPSSIATSKSCDMPMESTSMWTRARFCPAI